MITEKDATSFWAVMYKKKMIRIMACMILPLIFLAPVFLIKLCKYKKRFMAVTVLYIIAFVVFIGSTGTWIFSSVNRQGGDVGDLFTLSYYTFGTAAVIVFVLHVFFLLLCIGLRKSKEMKSIEHEAFCGEGKAGRKEFINTLVELSRYGDIDGFIHAVNKAHENYETRKHLFLPKKEVMEIIGKTVINCAIVEDKARAKALRKSMKELYKRRKYEEINALSDSYAVKCAAKRDELLKNSRGAPIALEYDGKSTFDGNILQRIGWNILCRIIMTLTLGIMYPTVLCIKMNWQVKHTVYNGKRLSFDGKGLQLFGKWICWWLLCVITLGIYTIFVAKKLEQWKAKHTHIAGEPAVLGGTFDGGIIVSWLYGVLCGLLNLITLGIAKPFSTCIKLTWKYKHTVYDGRRLSFNGNGLQLFGNYIKWWLLTVITLGIYSYFVTNRMLKWQAVHTSLSEQSELVM